MSYTVSLRPRAERALDGMPRQDRERVLRALQGLADDPLPRGVGKLQSRAPAWRLRVGQYRVIYAVFHHDQLILVAAIERRSERTYQDIDRLLS